MSRFLFVVPPLVGHVNPAVAVAGELVGRGHAVAWAGEPGLLARLLPDEGRVFACAVQPDWSARPDGLRGVAALKFLWERWFGPLAEAMLPGVAEAVERFRPDLIVADQQTVAGALAAERAGLPFVTLASTSGELTGAVGLPKVGAWTAELLAGLRARFGDPEAGHDPRFSPWLTIVCSTPELAGPVPPDKGPLAFVGPALGARPRDAAFPWDWVGEGGGLPLVLVTLGTANSAAGARFLGACVAAVRERADRLRAVVADPGGVLGPPSAAPGLLVRPAVPQLPLLAGAAAVVCHAGHNTVAEALWHGVPLVVAPIRDDQPVIAGQVTAAGAGVRVRFGRSGPETVGAALDAVLSGPGYAASARRVAASFRAAGGAAAAAEQVEQVERAERAEKLAAGT
ncbi:glycosyltransferase [Streptomyces sp. MP131-18]|uniref:glycosyltransferase n=1 Tax=Streptomyces sp. MP131-18 TaxID=1857892 RepID=UPI00097C92D6|nr:glycosyltransferase [Streptomyces sp. MP131-18]ONK14108.1 Oleandomycin glycosyltransferase [Streptomyces sp. MP131-18]